MVSLSDPTINRWRINLCIRDSQHNERGPNRNTSEPSPETGFAVTGGDSSTITYDGRGVMGGCGGFSDGFDFFQWVSVDCKTRTSRGVSRASERSPDTNP